MGRQNDSREVPEGRWACILDEIMIGLPSEPSWHSKVFPFHGLGHLILTQEVVPPGAQAGRSGLLPFANGFISLSQTLTHTRKGHQVQEKAAVRVHVPDRPLQTKGQEMTVTEPRA